MPKCAPKAPKRLQVGPRRHPSKAQGLLFWHRGCKTARTLKFDDSTVFFYVFLRFGRPREELGRRLEASLDGQIEAKWRLEASLETKLRLEASLESQVESKLALKSGWSGVQGPRTAAGNACWSELSQVRSLQPFPLLDARDILAEHFVGFWLKATPK